MAPFELAKKLAAFITPDASSQTSQNPPFDPILNQFDAY
jgi:hypothetical protein